MDFVRKARGKCKDKIYYISSQLGLVTRLEGAGCTTQPQQGVCLEGKQHCAVYPKWKEVVKGDRCSRKAFLQQTYSILEAIFSKCFFDWVVCLFIKFVAILTDLP